MTARAMWQLVEPVHAVTYFDDAAEQPLIDLGVDSFWDRYVLKRSAALGRVPAAVVTAEFFGFHPRRIESAVPRLWDSIAPDEALRARQDGVVAALAPYAADHDFGRIADLLWPMAQGAQSAGRALAAAEQSVPRPDDPALAAWQAMTVLREHRGCGHVSVLVSRGIGPVEAMQIKAAADESVGEHLRKGRGWSADDWAAGTAALRDRGWLTDDALSPAGAAAHDEIEAATDLAAEQPWRDVDPDTLDELTDLLRPLAVAVWSAGRIPDRNPIGVPRV